MWWCRRPSSKITPGSSSTLAPSSTIRPWPIRSPVSGAMLPGRIDGNETVFASPADLEAALKRAATAHGEHEKRMGGQHDANWPAWYAEYMVREYTGKDLPT